MRHFKMVFPILPNTHFGYPQYSLWFIEWFRFTASQTDRVFLCFLDRQKMELSFHFTLEIKTGH